MNELRYWESFYHNKFGGYENTYNTAYVIEPEWYCEPYNDVELVIDVDDADIINKLNSVPNKNEYIKRLIRRDMHKEKPNINTRYKVEEYLREKGIE